MVKKKAGAPAQESIKVLTDLEQIKVLADPLRVRILESLGLEERTTKQVADLLGEGPTKLYHHVEALERVGLIRMTRTRQNRGTLEKYYQAVARRFEADSRLFSESAAGGDDDGPMGQVISQLFERTGEELRHLAQSDAAADIKDKGLLTFCEIHADEKEILRIRRRLERLVKDLTKLCAEPESPTGKERRYRLTVAYFPLDRP
jgi:DNA-binding transcriptional ArsR family regulator